MRKKLWYYFLGCCAIIVLLVLLLYAFLHIGYNYTFYRDYKRVKNIKLLHLNDWEKSPFEVELSVKFVPKEHNGMLSQKIIVKAENKKAFMILRFDDNKIQLRTFPAKKYFNWKYLAALYEVTDSIGEKKLQELLDIYREQEE